LVFEKNFNFFDENWRKSPKIVENHQKLANIAKNCDHNIDPLCNKGNYSAMRNARIPSPFLKRGEKYFGAM
jgi:hypothetical protein